MDLNILWFVLVTVLFVGFFFLEGFDYGVGILLPFLSKDDTKRREIINSIGPFWDGNEVWLITAGGAMFAAFPHWYATMFSGFYLAMFIIVIGLIVRGVAFEFRSKVEHKAWRKVWDWMIFTGSAIPALLFPVAFANIMNGLAINAEKTYTGSFFELLNPYSLFVGVAVLVLLTYHGALFLSLKTTGEVLEKSKSVASKLSIPAIILAVLFYVYSALQVGFFDKGIMMYAVAGAAAVCLVLSKVFLIGGGHGKAFVMSSLTIVFVVVSMFCFLFPNVMISTNPECNLTIYNASSSEYTLGVMRWVAVIFVPVVLVYQAWTYWIFRQRVTSEHLEY